MRRLFFIPVALAALAAAPAPALAQTGGVWTPPQTLSSETGEKPQVAIADNGFAIAVWRELDPDPDGDLVLDEGNEVERIRFAERNRGGNFSPARRFLSPPTLSVGPNFSLAMNGSGDAVVVWEVPGQTVRARYKPAGRPFEGEQAVPAIRRAPQVAIDGSGSTRAIGLLAASDRVFSSFRPAGANGGATWSDPGGSSLGIFTKVPNGVGGPCSQNETFPSLAMNREGVAVVTASITRTSGQTAACTTAGFNGQEILASASFSGATALDGGTTITSASSGPFRSRAAIGVNGRQTTWWTRPVNPTRNYSTRGGPTGAWAAPATFGSLETGPTGDLAVTNNGSLLAAYANTSPDTTVHTAFAPFPGGFNPRQDFARDSVGRSPAIAMNQRDEALIAYKERGNLASAPGDEEAVQAAFRPAGPTARPARAVAPVSVPADELDDLDIPPSVDLSLNREGIAAWSRLQGVATPPQVSLFVPANVPRPPGALRPPPPLPSAIEVSRKTEPGGPLVLTVKVEGVADEVRWDFGQPGQPQVVGKVVNGKLQNSVRARLLDRSLTVRATVVGPGGSTKFTKKITQRKLPSDGAAGKAGDAINRVKPDPVYAVSTLENLVGTAGKASSARVRTRAAQTGCAPTVIWSGKQKTSGCFEPIENLGDIPGPEKGAIAELANGLGLDEIRKALAEGRTLTQAQTDVMSQATRLTEGYVTKGRALLNDEFPVIPSGPANVLALPQAKAVISANAELPIGQAKYDPAGGFNLKVDPAKANIPLGPLPNPPKLPSLAGLELTGEWDVDLQKQEAKIKASIKFPSSITKAGVSLQNEVILRATREKIVVDEVRIGPIDVDVVGLKVEKFQIQYLREPNQWDGQGKACLIGTACLDMIPPNGGITIKDGDLARAGATLQFPPPGIPLYAGVNLERIGFGVGLKPTRIFGSARLGVIQILKLDGRLFAAFPTSQTPFVLDRKEVGDAYPPHLYGSRFTRFTFGATAEALVDVPVIGETKLGSAYVLYEYPGYVAFGGGYNADMLDLLSIRGAVAAEADVERGVFDLHGEIRACIHLGIDLCSGATGHVSRGEGGTGGAGACVEFGPVSVGGGVRWNDLGDPYIWPIDGCKWSPFRIQVRQSTGEARISGKGPRASATQVVRGNASRAVLARESQVGVSQAGTYTIKVQRGKPSPVLRLDGAGNAPAIRVSGPGGTLVAPVGSGFLKTPDNKIRIMRFANRYAKITSIGFQNARPGTYTVQVLPGSAPVVAVQQATNPPAAKVKGTVTGKGRNRVLRYSVARRPSQKVVFSELTSSGAAQEIGSTAGGRGRIRFRSAPGSGRRRIVARFELAGIPAERKRVTTFKPQSPRLSKVRGLKIKRKGTRLIVSWKRTKGARRYEIAATMSGGRQRFATTRKRRAVIRRVPKYRRGRVTVRSVDDLRQSRPARKRFRATAKRPRTFRTLRKCKLVRRKGGKRKIRCSGKRKKSSRRARRR